jgi:hypothetical protein
MNFLHPGDPLPIRRVDFVVRTRADLDEPLKELPKDLDLFLR